jgi:hypothetical protein
MLQGLLHCYVTLLKLSHAQSQDSSDPRDPILPFISQLTSILDTWYKPNNQMVKKTICIFQSSNLLYHIVFIMIVSNIKIIMLSLAHWK